jgi:hypothetical protein
MPISDCGHCGSNYQWLWEEAFDKFGFGDGDYQVETYNVEEVLTIAGYEVEVLPFGMHNTIISSIKLNGIEQIAEATVIGYDDPREYLPAAIVTILDDALPADG